MPVYLISKQYTDPWGVNSTSYKNNVGDRVTATIKVNSTIRMSSVNGPLIMDFSVNQITSTSGSWLQEGFRVNDTVRIQRFTSNGSLMSQYTTTVVYVDDTLLDIAACQDWYSAAAGEFIVISVTNRGRGDLDLLINHVPNGQQGSAASLIDSETTRALFSGLGSLAVGATLAAVLTGNQSGQFFESASITRLTDPTTGERSYNITLVFINSGLYNDDAFLTGNCLKVYYRLEWSGKDAEVAYKTIEISSEDANTGWFNQAHNTSPTNATLVQGVGSIDYGQPSTFSIIVDGPTTQLGIGAMYRSVNDLYYKNQSLPQQRLTMAVPTTNLAVGTLTSFTNSNGAGYTLTVNSINTVGSVTTINVTFTPNAQMEAFFQAVEDGDRLFYLWVKCGNINLLAYKSQLTYTPAEGGPMNMHNSYAYLDHSMNYQSEPSDLDAMSFNTEDDIAYFGRFFATVGSVLESFTAAVVVKQISGNEEFVIDSAFFSLLATPVSNSGVYLVNETQSRNQILLDTSAKREVKLLRDPSIDTVGEYGLAIYYPIISRWEYWLNQANANIDFYPNQNKNWINYLADPNWEIKLKLSLVEDGLLYTHYADYPVKDYNSENAIQQSMYLYIDSTNAQVPVVVTNQLMRVEAFHTLTDGTYWNASEIWGQITVEPVEGSPRYDISTILPYDNDPNNPLSPISGSVIQITYPSATVAKMVCYFDPSKINLANGVKFTSKIKGCTLIIPEDAKTTTKGEFKTTTNNEIKTIA